MSLSRLFLTLRRTHLVWMLWIAVVLVPAVSGQDKVPEKTPEKAKDAEVIYPRSADGRAEAKAGRSSGFTGILAVALLLAAAGGWLFWRGRATPAGTVNVRKLAIAETKSLGNRQYLVVAAYEDKKFLLSVCPGRIELLTPLDASPTVKTP